MQSLDTSLGNLNIAIQRKNQQGEDYVKMVNALIEEITNFLNGLQQNNDNSADLQKQLAAANEQIRQLTEANAKTQEQLKEVQDKATAFEEQARKCNEELNQLRQSGQGNAEQIRKLQQDLANAQQIVDQANTERAELLKQLEERTGRIQENVAQIAQMHINKEDTDELNANSQRLRDLIARLVVARGPGGAGGPGSSGRGNGGLPAGAGKQGITRLLGKPGAPSAARNMADRNADVMASRLGASELPLAPSGPIYNPAKSAGGEDPFSMTDIYKERKDETNPQGRQPVLQRAALRREPHYMLPKNAKGGKTKRRRTYRKKTMHRGGYVEKLKAKKTRKRSRTSKRRSGRKSTASSSSSSASSNSRQKSMQGRKM